MAAFSAKSLQKLSHHEKKVVCSSRAKYREGRRDTAVKVYTVNQESVYLLIQGVPAVGTGEDLRSLCEQYGVVDDFRPLDDYPSEEFTEVYLVKYNWFSAARTAKKHLDDKSFFGGILHVCYAPEFETVHDTRKKLQDRRKFIANRTREVGINDGKAGKPYVSKNLPYQKNWTCNNKVQNEDAKNVQAKFHASMSNQSQPVTYIWAGKEYSVFPESPGSTSGIESCGTRNSSEQCSKQMATSKTSVSQPFIPRQLSQSGQKRTNLEINEKHQETNLQTDINSGSSDLRPHLTESSSYTTAISSIRKKLLNTSVPNTRISFKRKKRI